MISGVDQGAISKSLNGGSMSRPKRKALCLAFGEWWFDGPAPSLVAFLNSDNADGISLEERSALVGIATSRPHWDGVPARQWVLVLETIRASYRYG